MKVDSSIYLAIQGIKFTIKIKHNKWHIAFNSTTDGKRVNRSTGLEATKSNLVVVKKEILQQIATELVALKHLPRRSILTDDETLLEDFAQEYFILYENSVRPHVYKKNKNHFEQKILPYFKDRSLQSIKPMQLESWQNRLLTQHKPSSVKKYRSVFYGIFTRAIQNELLNKNPFDHVEAPKKKRGVIIEEESINPFTDKEIEVLIQPDGTYMPHFIELMSNTGMRPGEIIALTWNDIDFKRKTININKTMVHGKVGLPKTGSSIRVIDMLAAAEEALKKQYELTKDYENVFISSEKKPFYSHDIINLNLKKRLKQHGMEEKSLYQLRHTFASKMISQGISIPWVSSMLGHKDVSITLSTYTHFIKEDEDTRLRNIDKINEQLAC